MFKSFGFTIISWVCNRYAPKLIEGIEANYRRLSSIEKYLKERDKKLIEALDNLTQAINEKNKNG